jgi:hypothetical protein
VIPAAAVALAARRAGIMAARTRANAPAATYRARLPYRIDTMPSLDFLASMWCEHDLRPPHQSPGTGDPLLLPARELPGPVLKPIPDAQRPDREIPSLLSRLEPGEMEREAAESGPWVAVSCPAKQCMNSDTVQRPHGGRPGTADLDEIARGDGVPG